MLVCELIEALEKQDRDAEVFIEVAKRIGKRIRITLETPCGTREANTSRLISPPTNRVIIETIGDTF